MARKVVFILFLISLLISFFFFRSYFYSKKEIPSLLDRVPDADLLGRIKVLEFARQASSMLYYNKLPFRDLLTPEFLLAQAKNYGLDIQRPSYFFGNLDGEYGALFHVNDSSKIYAGIARIAKGSKVKDTIIGKQRLHVFVKNNMFLTFGKEWLFIYQGDSITKRMYHIVYSKKGDQSLLWKSFLKQNKSSTDKLMFCLNNPELKKYGIKKAVFTHQIDSVSFRIKMRLESDAFFALYRKTNGVSFQDLSVNNRLINVHLDVSKLRKTVKMSHYKILAKYNQRINFPIASFLNAWEGDLSYYESDSIMIKEKLIETVYDQDFNSKEVETFNFKKIPSFALLFSVNASIATLLLNLKQKGILCQEKDKYRFLFYPLLSMKLNENILYFYSSDEVPKTYLSSRTNASWFYGGRKIKFELDSLNRKEAFGTFILPVNSFFKGKSFF